MMNTKKTYAIFGENELEFLQLILWSWIKNLKLLTIRSCGNHRAIGIIKRVFFIRKYAHNSIEEDKTVLSRFKGLYYRVSNEALELTLRYYEKEIKDKSNIAAYYNKILNTGKFEAYIKKNISFQIFELLKGLHIVRFSDSKENNIIIIKNSVNEFVVKYMEDTYNIRYQARWVLSAQSLFSLCEYYRQVVMEFFRRGIVFNKNKKNYKLSKESAWGFSRATLRDDIIIDDDRFKKNDILMLEFNSSHQHRKRVFEEAKEKGFDAVSVDKLKINITKNVFNLLWFYFWVPVKVCFKLFIERQMYLYCYISVFHKRCFPIEILMNLYNIKCNISNSDWGDVEETIIFNKYGAKNIIFHWSDLTSCVKHFVSFIAHNNYFFWGDTHYNCYSINYFIDNKLNVGCIYKKKIKIASENKEFIKSKICNLRKDKKIVVFFDNAFSDDCYATDQLFLDYLNVITVFSKSCKDINVLLKPKDGDNYELALSSQSCQRYRALRDELLTCDNFISLNSDYFEEIIAISDVCVNMGMNSPSTVALICGKDGLYFDNTGNREHPFAKKYMNKIVFEDEALLIKQIENILEGKFRCRDVISEEETRGYDSFADDNALERIRDSLRELTL